EACSRTEYEESTVDSTDQITVYQSSTSSTHLPHFDLASKLRKNEKNLTGGDLQVLNKLLAEIFGVDKRRNKKDCSVGMSPI
ncbi:hypothetical protein PFISCL1PPCAC_28230, partial [Pristionchus fissidentatus]